MVRIGVRRVVFVGGRVRGRFRERGIVLALGENCLTNVIRQDDRGEVDKLLRELLVSEDQG